MPEKKRGSVQHPGPYVPGRSTCLTYSIAFYKGKNNPFVLKVPHIPHPSETPAPEREALCLEAFFILSEGTSLFLLHLLLGLVTDEPLPSLFIDVNDKC